MKKLWLIALLLVLAGCLILVAASIVSVIRRAGNSTAGMGRAQVWLSAVCPRAALAEWIDQKKL